MSNGNPGGSPRRRILWLSHLLPWPPKGGVQQRSYYLMRELSKYHDVHVIAFSQRAHQPDAAAVDKARQAIAEFATVHAVLDLPEDKTPGGRTRLALHSLLPGPPYTIRWGSSPEYGAAVSKAVADLHPDLIHFDTISLAPYTSLCGDRPLTLNHHNIESHMLIRRAAHERNPAKRLYFWQEGQRVAITERSTARRFSLHLVCSELDAQRLEASVGCGRVEVVPNGADLNYFNAADELTKIEPRTLIFVGGLSWYPNASAVRVFLRDVWPGVARRYPDTRFRIIGRSPPPDLQRLAATDSRIELLGFVDDIRPHVHVAAVYVCPIFDGGGTKLKMIDAMAMGKAIVAHPASCEGLFLDDSDVVLKADSAEAFIHHIGALFDDPVLSSRLAGGARRHVERHFSVRRIGAELAETYSRLK